MNPPETAPSPKRSPQERLKPTPRGRFLIALTGSRHEDHFRVDVNGKPASLPYASFSALVSLVCARAQSESGFISIARSTIYRLRKALDANAKAGKSLIETGSGEEYRLTIPKAKLRASVCVASGFFDLVERNLITKEHGEILRLHCRRCKAASGD
jgi:hypothetical protein